MRVGVLELLVVDAAVDKAYGGKRKISWMEVYAGEKATQVYDQDTWLPEETLEASWLCHIFSYLYVLESLYDGFYMVNSDLKFVVWNRGIEKLLGYMAHDILEQTWSPRQLKHADVHGEPLSDCQIPMQQVISTDAYWSRFFLAPQYSIDNYASALDFLLRDFPNRWNSIKQIERTISLFISGFLHATVLSATSGDTRILSRKHCASLAVGRWPAVGEGGDLLADAA